MKVKYSNKHFRRIRDWAQNHRIAAWTIGSLGLVLIAGVATFLLLYLRPGKPILPIIPEKKPEPVKYYSLLTGTEVANKDAVTQPVTGLMIENFPTARPQSGLKNSGVIFEAIAEGGITRFLVLYQSEKPQVIGPVRSLRLYDVEWVNPFEASIGHVGGSAAALAEVRNGQYRDIDQFFNSGSYYRVNNRPAPHNVYTGFDRLDALNKSKGYTSSNFVGFPRTDEKPVKKTDATQINVTISSATYNSSYTYDAAKNNYLRYQAGELHLDREDGNITPKVVIVMTVNETTIFEDGYREKIDTVGSGKADIFQNGTVITGTWTKSSKTSQVTFADAAGKEIKLVRGQTWITAVPGNRGGGVTWE